MSLNNRPGQLVFVINSKGQRIRGYIFAHIGYDKNYNSMYSIVSDEIGKQEGVTVFHRSIDNMVITDFNIRGSI